MDKQVLKLDQIVDDDSSFESLEAEDLGGNDHGSSYGSPEVPTRNIPNL